MNDASELFDRLNTILNQHTNEDGATYVKDILIREDECIRLVTPRGLVPASKPLSNESQSDQHEEIVLSDAYVPWSREDIITFFDRVDPDWAEKIRHGAVDRPITTSEKRLRANLFTYNGEFSTEVGSRMPGKLGLAMRVFPKRIPTLNELRLPAFAAEMMNSRRGMIFLTGGTGAGKSTTGAAIFQRLNQTCAGHLITLENPIEYVHENDECAVSQREVGLNMGSMARGVRDAMREFPLAILIGEVRDAEAAEAAIFAGESGHLVVGTLHSNSAVGCLTKMTGFFPGSEKVHAEAIAQSLLGVIAQTLVPNAEGTGWVPIYEAIVLTEKTRELVAQRNWGDLLDLIRKGDAEKSVRSLNDSFMQAIAAKQVTEKVALQYTYDKAHLASLLSTSRR